MLQQQQQQEAPSIPANPAAAPQPPAEDPHQPGGADAPGRTGADARHPAAATGGAACIKPEDPAAAAALSSTRPPSAAAAGGAGAAAGGTWADVGRSLADATAAVAAVRELGGFASRYSEAFAGSRPMRDQGDRCVCCVLLCAVL